MKVWFALSMLVLVGGCAPSRLATPVVVVDIPTPPRDPHPMTAIELPPEVHEPLASAMLVGTWQEDFAGRPPGCADLATINLGAGGGLTLDSEECNEHKPYQTESVSFDGNELKVTLMVPDTGLELRYRFSAKSRRILEGEVEVASPTLAQNSPDDATSHTYSVKWTKIASSRSP